MGDGQQVCQCRTNIYPQDHQQSRECKSLLARDEEGEGTRQGHMIPLAYVSMPQTGITLWSEVLGFSLIHGLLFGQHFMADSVRLQFQFHSEFQSLCANFRAL